jgi:hypothetical protein
MVCEYGRTLRRDLRPSGRTLQDQTPGGRSGSACFEDKSFHGGPDETTGRTLGMQAVIQPRAQGCVYLDPLSAQQLIMGNSTRCVEELEWGLLS